jgi:hypothetical protein
MKIISNRASLFDAALKTSKLGLWQWLWAAGVLFCACTTQQASEPVSRDLPRPAGDLSVIDPDQKALPKEAPELAEQVAANEPVSKTSETKKPPVVSPVVSTDSSVPVAAASTPAESARPQAAPAAAPDSSAGMPETFEDMGHPISTDPETITSQQASPVKKVGPPGRFGSGPQTNFIKATILTIRSQPNRYSKILGYLNGGDEVHVKMYGDWAKLDDGQWIRSRWLVKVRPGKFVGSDYHSAVDPSGDAQGQASRKSGKRKTSTAGGTKLTSKSKLK